MNKKTKMIVGVVAVAGIAYFLLKKKDKVFANAVGKSGQRKMGQPVGCVLYEKSCQISGGGLAPVGLVLNSWQGVQGIIVANNENRCLVCPKSDTATGLPSS